MDTSPEDQSVISEQLWRAWAHRDKLREKATARKQKILAGIIAGLVTIAAAVYFAFSR